jgi:hypothetical protein
MVLVLVLAWSPSSHHHHPWSCPVLGWLRWPAACVPESSSCQPRCLHPHPCVVSLSQFSRSWSWSWHRPGPRSWSSCLRPSCRCHCRSHPSTCGPWSRSLHLSPSCRRCGPVPAAVPSPVPVLVCPGPGSAQSSGGSCGSWFCFRVCVSSSFWPVTSSLPVQRVVVVADRKTNTSPDC